MSISMRIGSQPKLVLFKLLLCLLFLTFSSAVSAETLDLNKIPKLKEYDFSANGEFEKNTRIEKEENPYDDKYISYEFRVPKKWTENSERSALTKVKIPQGRRADSQALGLGAMGLSSNVLGILGKYVGPPTNLLRSHVVVEAQELGYEISARNWFVQFILKNGFTLAGYTEKSSDELEALYVEVINDQSYIVRTRVVINGPRLIMFRHYLPQENYDEEKLSQAQIVASLKLLNPVDEGIEKRQEYGFLDQSYFNYPVSWEFTAKPIYSIERMSATLMQKKGDKDSPLVLEGQIKIAVTSRLLKTTLAEETEKFRSSIAIKNYTLGDFIENIPVTYDKSITMGQTQAYKLVPANPVSMKSYEFMVSVMQGNDYYYIISLLTPSREQDFYNWSRNLEAFRIVVETTRRSNVKLPTIDTNDPYFDYLKE
jgi:hypothetical protein